MPEASRKIFFACASDFSSSANGAGGSFFEGWPGEDFVAKLHSRGNQRQNAAHRAFHQHLDDEHAVDFVGAFENAIHAAVAIGARHGIIFVETVAAENLHAFVHAHNPPSRCRPLC